jgi:hypothetical protein
MGTWGPKPFDSDRACDFAYELKDYSDLFYIEYKIDVILKKNRIDYWDCSEALGAIDTVARLKGKFGVRNGYTEDVDKWVKEHPIEPPKKMVKKALKALEMIAGESSDFAKSFQDCTFLEEWKTEMKALKSRLKA